MPRKNRNTRRPVILLVIGFILIIGAAIIFTSEFGGNQASSAQNPSIPYPEIARTNLADAKEAFDIGSMVFLDVRTAGEYAQRRIPGSINIPLDELGDRLGELDPADQFLTICT